MNSEHRRRRTSLDNLTAEVDQFVEEEENAENDEEIIGRANYEYSKIIAQLSTSRLTTSTRLGDDEANMDGRKLLGDFDTVNVEGTVKEASDIISTVQTDLAHLSDLFSGEAVTPARKSRGRGNNDSQEPGYGGEKVNAENPIPLNGQSPGK
eukprot:Nk52_evm1s121 gene=Nk52_evmTU1s121